MFGLKDYGHRRHDRMQTDVNNKRLVLHDSAVGLTSQLSGCMVVGGIGESTVSSGVSEIRTKIRHNRSSPPPVAPLISITYYTYI